MLRFSIFAFVISLLIPWNASAFMLHMSDEGDYVKWHRGEVEVVLDASLEKLGPRERVEDVIMRSFDLWTDATDIPFVFAFRRGHCSPHANNNETCVAACDDRLDCYDRQGEKGATTYLHYLPSSGRITGASIVFNAADWEWDIGGTPPPSIIECDTDAPPMSNPSPSIECVEKAKRDAALNLSRVAGHEIGHLLGIDHSANENALMYYLMERGDVSVAHLHEDDVNAAITLYSYSDASHIEAAEAYSSCMSTAAGRVPTTSIFTLLAVLLGAWLSFRVR